MKKYEQALEELRDIAGTAARPYSCAYRACDGWIGVAVNAVVNGRVNRSDPGYRTLRSSLRDWYCRFHDAKVAEWSFADADDGFGARLFSAELKGECDG